MEKSEFRVLIKHWFLMRGKILFKQSNSLTSVIRTLLRRKQRLRGGILNFKHGRTNTNDAERSVRPNSAVVSENAKKLHKLILANDKLMLRKIAGELEISEGSVFTILHEHLSMRKLSSKLVLSPVEGCPGYEVKWHPMVKLLFWSSGTFGVYLRSHYSHVHCDSVLIPIRMSSIMDQIDLFRNFVFDRNTWYYITVFKLFFNGISTLVGYLMPKPSF